MRNFNFCFLLIINLIYSIPMHGQFNNPETPAIPVVDELHGVNLTDNYQWLEDKTDDAVIEWTKTQHDATMSYLNENMPEMPGLKNEIEAYIDRDVISPLRLVAERQFYTMKKKGEKQSKLYTIIDNEDQLIFDPVKIDPTGKSSFTGIAYTKKGERAAVGLQSKGAEIRTYYIIDTRSGELLHEPISGLRGFSWTKDEKQAYIWVRTQEMINKQEAIQIYLHTIGSERSNDKFLMSPSDAKYVASISDARYSDVTLISEGDFYATHSLKIKDVGSDDDPVEIYSSHENKVEAFALGDKIYFKTNDNAPNFKLMVADKNKPGFDSWTELYGEKETVFENYTVTPDYLLIQDKKDVVSRIMLYSLDGKFIKELALPEIGNVAYVNYNRDVDALFVGLTTFTKPFKIYKINPDELKSTDLNWELFYEQEAAINTEDIESKIDFYESKDGTKVPLFIMHKKGLKLDGNNPTLLYGYGGFNIGMSPNYIGSRAMFINRGGVYAIACIRGGDEYGEQWHKDGMLFKKQNTFDDFISAAEYLIDQDYTSEEKLAVQGGSNGGLLIGAVVTQRPDLFKSAICAVPLLDMIRYHKFLIARYWIPEYGDPDVKEDFKNILTYSPYHNIRGGIDLPMTLVVAGENDSRVDPLHAKKFVAAVQNNVGQINPFMLYMDYDSGHGSGKSTEQQINDMEFQLRFIMRSLGM